MTLLDQIGEQSKFLRVSGNCQKCPRQRINFVPATLERGPVLWLGEAPGATEVKEQEGFVGTSGQLLRRVAAEVGVPGPWSFSNTIHCRPPENAEPTPKEIACCLSQFVLDEIKGYPYVVMVGKVPLAALFPKARASHFRGNFAHHPDYPGQRFYAIYHPAYIGRRSTEMMPVFKQQLERLARVVKGGPGAEPTFRILRGATEGKPALDAMLAGPIISLDLETSETESWVVGAHTKSLCVTADGETVVAVHQDEAWFIAAITAIQAFLEDPSKTVVGANVAFDIEWLEEEFSFTAKCAGIHDPAIWWYEAGQYKQPSLKQLVAERLDGYRHLVHLPHLTNDVDLLLQYNAEDVVYPIHLIRKASSITAAQTQDLVSRVLSPATLVLRRMQTHGIYIRQDYRDAKIREYEQKRSDTVNAWHEMDPEFTPSKHESGNGLLEYLFKIRRLPVIGQTGSGEAATDKSVIKQYIREGATYLEHLLEIRRIDKLLSTYLRAYDDHLDSNSRIHPHHWLASTDTSRPTSTNPNVYNFPRNLEIRDMVGVPPGQRLVEFDLSQIEFRIMVCRAGDENGISGYLRGLDAHTMTAITISGNQTPTKEQRSEAKPVNFALLYGGDWPVVQRQAQDEFGKDWDEPLCRRFTDGFFETYPRIRPFHDLVRTNLVANGGWFQSITGHVFKYEGWDSPERHVRDHVFRSAINSEGQGPASNICLYIAVLARRMLDARGMASARFVNSVYDSIMVEVPKPKWVPDIIDIVREATQQAHEWVKHWFVVPLLIDAKVGTSWGSLKEV